MIVLGEGAETAHNLRFFNVIHKHKIDFILTALYHWNNVNFSHRNKYESIYLYIYVENPEKKMETTITIRIKWNESYELGLIFLKE